MRIIATGHVTNGSSGVTTRAVAYRNGIFATETTTAVIIRTNRRQCVYRPTTRAPLSSSNVAPESVFRQRGFATMTTIVAIDRTSPPIAPAAIVLEGGVDVTQVTDAYLTGHSVTAWTTVGTTRTKNPNGAKCATPSAISGVIPAASVYPDVGCATTKMTASITPMKRTCLAVALADRVAKANFVVLMDDAYGNQKCATVDLIARMVPTNGIVEACHVVSESVNATTAYASMPTSGATVARTAPTRRTRPTARKP